MTAASWEELTKDLKPDAVEKLRAARAFCLSIGETRESITRTQIRFYLTRTYCEAFIISGRLELTVDLLHSVKHPRLIAVFPTTSQVITHRFSLPELADFDDQIKAWIVEGYETVGPGFRKTKKTNLIR